MTDLRAALGNPNVAAFLHIIRQGETSQDDTAYRVLNGGLHFEAPPWVHPYHGRTTTEVGHSTAAGAYQHLGTSWAELCRQYGFTDFSPPLQDLGAVGGLVKRGALDDVLAGRIPEAIIKCRPEWTSLPGASENRRLDMDRALGIYVKYGGKLETQAEAPIEERTIQPAEPTSTIAEGDTMATDSPGFGEILGNVATAAATIFGGPMGGAAVTFAKMLVSGMSPLIKEKITHHFDNSPASQQLAEAVVGAAQQLTGNADALQATAAALKDPAVMAQLEQKSLDVIASMAPILDKLQEYERNARADDEASRTAAAVRFDGDQNDMAQPLMYGMLAMVGLLIVFVCSVAAYQVLKTGSPGVEVWAAVTGLIGFATGVATTIYAFRFGTSKSSAAKDATIGVMARKGLV